MISREEREEIAKKLREVCKVNTNWSMTTHAAFYKISDIISAQYMSYEAFFNRLADLIDPTCVNIAVPNDTSPFVCSKCGYGGICFKPCGIHMDGTSDWTNLLPQFCPNCGARVVRDE